MPRIDSIIMSGNLQSHPFDEKDIFKFNWLLFVGLSWTGASATEVEDVVFCENFTWRCERILYICTCVCFCM